ncbi:hypothetical protein NX059_002467 [Plenodomus lindquistii]|nr:hypothetical protein NX059_002467 [Plenodomus lindquistii]
MTSTSRYDYQTLEPSDIRLLHLLPAQRDAQIRVSLIHVRLDDAPAFEALSYTWGDVTVGHPIYCDDTGKVLLVTKNCEDALRALQEQDIERILWIDAICINQQNLDERSSQILLMPDIYTRAVRVVAFLGAASGDSDVAMDFIIDDANPIQRNGRPSISPLQRRAINGILERPYFTRVWILQEVMLAKEVHAVIGDRSVDWRSFTASVYYVQISANMHVIPVYTSPTPAVMLWRDYTGSGRPQTLLQFLDQSRHCDATDPRDKVFALLAMTPENSEQELLPNYRQSVQDVYISLARYLITRDGNLDVLSHCTRHEQFHKFPSWVPDWSTKRTSKAFIHPSVGTKTYMADGGLTPSIRFDNKTGALHLQGRIIDSISRVQPSTGVLETGLLELWEEIALAAMEIAPRHTTKDVFLETLTAYPYTSHPPVNPFERFYPAWRSSKLRGRIAMSGDTGSAAMVQNMVEDKCLGRAFFSTIQGHVGIGPSETQEHHVVAALLGGRMLNILEPLGDDRYTLIGECFVHGMMNGQAVQEANGDFQTFKIPGDAGISCK